MVIIVIHNSESETREKKNGHTNQQHWERDWKKGTGVGEIRKKNVIAQMRRKKDEVMIAKTNDESRETMTERRIKMSV